MKKRLEGTVVSDRMDKTRVVQVERIKSDKMYHKEVRLRKKYKIDDPKNESRIGDRVLIEECRHLSKDKCWRLLNIIKSS